MILTPFHLAIPVHDLALARNFYGHILGCKEGRSSVTWIDYNFFGHQFVVHYKEGMKPDLHFNAVDDHSVPIPHFGVILPWEAWEKLAKQLENKVEFIIKPYIRFKGEIGEQATLFFLDPSGNALEFKSFRDMTQVFAR